MYTERTNMAKNSPESSRRDGLVRMNTEDIRTRQWSEAEKRAVREAAKARAEGRDLPEEEYEDIPRLTEEQLNRMVRFRDIPKKVPVSVRLDPRVLDWLRSKGEGHLTRINDILFNLMEAERNLASGRK
ncbi:BrnA antitoxin family protein [Acidobacteria bacterium AB60]|nr:BrnA antitoxin family protein [Acidobacteria bacterium AB60]